MHNTFKYAHGGLVPFHWSARRAVTATKDRRSLCNSRRFLSEKTVHRHLSTNTKSEELAYRYLSHDSAPCVIIARGSDRQWYESAHKEHKFRDIPVPPDSTRHAGTSSITVGVSHSTHSPSPKRADVCSYIVLLFVVGTVRRKWTTNGSVELIDMRESVRLHRFAPLPLESVPGLTATDSKIHHKMLAHSIKLVVRCRITCINQRAVHFPMVKRAITRENDGFQGLLSAIERVCTKLERGKLVIHIVKGC